MLLSTVRMRHAGDEAQVGTQGPAGIVEGAARTGYAAGQLCIAEGEGQVHDDDEKRGDPESERSSFFQSQIPAEIHPRDHISHTQSPEHGGIQRPF